MKRGPLFTNTVATLALVASLALGGVAFATHPGTGQVGEITSAVIKDGSLTWRDFERPGRIGAKHIAANAIGRSELRANSVQETDIRSDSVNGDKVEDNSLTSYDIRNGTLTVADLAPGTREALIRATVRELERRESRSR